VVVARPRQDPVDLAVAEDGGDAQGGLAFAIGDAGICAGGEQALHLAQVAARHCGMQQRISERTLRVGIAEDASHAATLPSLHDSSRVEWFRTHYIWNFGKLLVFGWLSGNLL
jgi:hypothetical protein